MSEGAGSKLKLTAAPRSRRSGKVRSGRDRRRDGAGDSRAGRQDTAAIPDSCFFFFFLTLFFFFLNAASDTLLNAQLSNASLRLPLMLALKVRMASPF